MSTPKLFLLDAFALIFRAHFAFIRNPRITRKGLDTSAIYGFMLALIDVLEKQQPTHIGVVFDIGGSASRTERYADYKANRDATPEGIKIAVPYIHQLLDAVKIPALGLEGYEADDVIGTLAQQAEAQGFDVYMMTPDKDFGQLVTEKIKMFKPGRSGNPHEVIGIKEVCDKWQIQRVEQVVDILGMMGDASDNIPGLPGVGAKTAAKLLAQFDSLEGTIAHADEIKGKLGERIREHKAQGIMSKELARIITDVPVTLDVDGLLRKAADEPALTALLEVLEFRSLARRILPQSAPVESLPVQPPKPAKKVAASAPSTGGQMDMFAMDSVSELTAIETKELYQCIDSDEGVQALVRLMQGEQSIYLSCLCDGEDAMTADFVGLALSWSPSKAYYIPMPSSQVAADTRWQLLAGLLQDPSIGKGAHDIKFVSQVLRQQGVELQGIQSDPMLAHYLLEPDRRHDLASLASLLTDIIPLETAALLGPKGKQRKTFRQLPASSVLNHACQLADMALQVDQVLLPMLASKGIDGLYNDLEIPLVDVLSHMESAGIRVDQKGLASYSEELKLQSADLEQGIFKQANCEFNLGSPRQLGEVLFDRMALSDKAKKTKTGQYATGEEVLEGLQAAHPIIKDILEWRQVGKLRSTYVDALPQLVHPGTGRIHSTFNQAVASTGRLSSTNPNLQNIPIRTERGRVVRGLFVPRDKDHQLLCADYSQIELRVIASMSGDQAMIDAFNAGEDIHATTAANIFHCPIKDVTREQRGHAKTVNFGIIYGVSAFGLAQQTNLSRSEAKAIIDSYFATYPGIKDYIDAQVASARDKGFVETLMGRRRYLRDINSRNGAMRGHAERNAINAPIQGSAADIVKLAMLKVAKALDEGKFEAKLILQVHDELVFDAPRQELEKLQSMVKTSMESAYQLKVPLIVDVGLGDNWLEAH
ncbi:MAG: DNA polymerase I [Schleiferiaceae bacterium]|nr:DNA polymerase I [Flavobacteriales bacterium]MDO7566613.1 DNA polymerase I [Schleiferiaceae bacterium]MDO7584190.1 DNA polymerase I [Schleiferiaceae bacterium]MDO7592552.1 DNA polymerase I [Schleiferiaceae bacterium]MDO7601604.1 DNA polymerase I [Schleiferiaceae bacterium]